MSREEVILTPNPRGRFEECIISGTPYPGTCMTIKAGVEMDDTGVFTYEPFNADAADGERFTVAVLYEDFLQGKTKENAYADGARGFLYFPVAGEELMMRIKNVSGTADDYTIGQRLIIDDSTGELIATTGSPESEPFQMLETVTDPTAAFWAMVKYTGQ